MVDFGRNASDYAKRRQGFPGSLWLRLQERGLALPHHRVLDVGTGTGKIAHALHALGCKVEGIDRDPNMIAAALHPGIDFRVATAEETGASDAAFDLVIAGQCWHWFDRARAAKEAKRVLASGGTLCMAHFDFLRGFPVVDATWKTIEPLRDVPLPPASTMGEHTLYVEWLTDLKDAGFVNPETFSYQHDARYTREAWRGRMRASVWVGATLDSERTSLIDAKLEKMLLSFNEPFVVPHRVSVVFATKP